MATICVTSAAAIPFTRRMASGTSGLATRSSLTTKAASITAAPASVAIVRVVPQPTSGAFTKA